MSTYREIVGKKIKKVSSDPSSGTDGEMWYNSTTGTLRGPAIVEAWSSGPPINTARGSFASATASQTAGLIFGGYTNPPEVIHTGTEEYDGSGWSTGGALPAARCWLMGAGTQTAALGVGGYNPTSTAKQEVYNYNGTAWSSNPHTIPTGVAEAGSAGTQTSALIFGGRPPTNPAKNTSFEYDGSSWTSGGTLNTARRMMAGGGTQTSARAAGGVTHPSTTYVTTSEEYNGSAWTADSNINTARRDCTGSAVDADSMRITGGYKAPGSTLSADSESWNGSSWSEGPNISAATVDAGPSSFASSSATIFQGGVVSGGGYANATEEFNSSTTAVTAAAWASIPTYPTPNSYSAGFGTTTASVVAGGDGPPGNGITTTGEYDGSSWTTGGALNTGRRGLGAATNGSETAGLVFGGSNPGVPTQYANVEEYNGSAWSEETNLPGTLNNLGGFGTQTAGAALPPSSATTLEYDGSSWASGGNLTTTRDKTMGGGAGLQTAGLCIAGGPVPGVSGGIEEYNGTAWTATVPSTYINDNNASNGIQTAALSMGASNPPSLAAGIQYDGTTARTVANMGTGRYAATASGSAGNSSALAITGRTPPRSNACEEYTEETSSANIKDFTTS